MIKKLQNKSGIYKLTSPSGKSYIGQSINLDSRLNKYKNNHCKKQYKIYNALLKYGWDNFEIEILYETTSEFKHINTMLDALEIRYIKKFDSINNGYNITRGGGGSSGRKHSDESKLKMSKARIGNKRKPFSDEHKLKIGIANKNKIVSSETKLKMSESRKGKGVKTIIQYNLDGIFIKEWNSIKEAQETLNITGGISKCCQNKVNTAGGYKWKYKELE